MSPDLIAPSANPVEAVNPEPFDLERPWLSLGYPEGLTQLLFPPDPWDLAERCGVLFGAGDEIRAWSVNPAMRQQSFCRERVQELLGYHLERRHAAGWEALSAKVRAMPAPVLPDHVLHMLPPLAPTVLAGLWSAYQQDFLRELWTGTTENPQQDWRVAGLFPPFRVPDPALVPPPPVEPAPDLWLAWTRPHDGVMAPVLLRSVAAPRPLDAPELQHTSGWTQAPTVIECPVALDHPDAVPVIHCLYHWQRGVWGDTDPGPE